MASKLFYAPRSPFALKVRIFVHELVAVDDVEFVAIDPWTDESLRGANPLCKVPTLILENGRALYDSPVICQYLNEHAQGRLIPRSGPHRWDALRREALGDGLAEAVIRRFVEQLGPMSDRSYKVAIRQEAAIAASLDSLEEDPFCFDSQVDIGDIAVAAALVYLSMRSPEIAWRTSRPRLARAFETFSARPSMVGNRASFRRDTDAGQTN